VGIYRLYLGGVYPGYSLPGGVYLVIASQVVYIQGYSLLGGYIQGYSLPGWVYPGRYAFLVVYIRVGIPPWCICLSLYTLDTCTTLYTLGIPPYPQ